MQVVWDIMKREQKREIAPYKTPAASSYFVKRASVRSRRVKVWTREEIEKLEKEGGNNGSSQMPGVQ